MNTMLKTIVSMVALVVFAGRYGLKEGSPLKRIA